MLNTLLQTITGSRNARFLRRSAALVARINEQEDALRRLPDAALRAKTEEFRQRLKEGATLNSLLVEAFAVAREAGQRVLGMRHFDVQLQGGIALHEGRIAEMRTGEGKTLVATLPVYLNALSGKGVHLVTVNDYLAQRDARWMGPLYEFLGLQVGVVVPHQDFHQKRLAYQADVSYATNNELGFDYLRDNMVYEGTERASGAMHYAIIDEVDSVLIDEARTPLIISGKSEDSSILYRGVNQFIPQLRRQEEAGLELEEEEKEGDFVVDEKARHVELTELGHQKVEQMMSRRKLLAAGDSLYSPANLNLLHYVQSALRAHTLYHRDVDYLVQDNRIVLIDDHTGRTMPNRRLSEGLHQALEAKENLPIQSESQTLASITFQNYFRLYQKLAGMTGTAETEAREFRQIYGLEVVVIPTHKPMIREDLNDLVFFSKEEKFAAAVEDIQHYRERGAPVLIGTASVETSEYVSRLLQRQKIPHQVLNARHHAQEAEIIAQAGRPGTVTIATNMAGRGTDIVLGGNFEAEIQALREEKTAKPAADKRQKVRRQESQAAPTPSEEEEQAPPSIAPPAPAPPAPDTQTPEEEACRRAWQERHDAAVAVGGLHILATERHESRRIDNQLRGRAGRQGDPGLTQFFLSMEDDLLRVFIPDRIKRIMQSLGAEKGEAIEHRMVTNAIAKAQRKVEQRNFDVRKQLLEYDDVANEQRQVIYRQRREMLAAEDLSDMVLGFLYSVTGDIFGQFVAHQSLPEQWDLAGLERRLETELLLKVPLQQWFDSEEMIGEEQLRTQLLDAAEEQYRARREEAGEQLRQVEKHVLLHVMDTLWQEHLVAMDHLRQSIHLRAYAQRNPKQEYKRESFQMFEEMLQSVQHEALRLLSRIELRPTPAQHPLPAPTTALATEQTAEQAPLHAPYPDAAFPPATPSPPPSVQRRPGASPKVGRNAPCPCGSGKKFKYCHGRD